MKSLLKTLPDSAAQGTRAALYLRVSTNRQVDNDLSIPDQRQQAVAFCKARGWDVAAEFVDAGLSGTDENRPELQRLLELYQAIETGLVDLGDDTLKTRVAALKAGRDQAKAALERAFAELRPETRITEEKIDAFARLMRENVTQGAIPFRRAYLRAVIDQVEVDDDEVRIHGRRDVLERLVMSGTAAAAVPSFVRKWRAAPGEDDNYVYSIAL